MALRKIKIYSTSGVSGTVETNISTLGQLLPLLSEREINYSGMKMLVGETRNELSQDEALLPEGDFKLYLMPQKTKSGNDERLAELYETIGDCHRAIAEIHEEKGSGRMQAKQVYTPVVSREDEEAMADLRRLQSGSPQSDWG
jgi:hypothetical protein